ncbi:MAG: hypothetical protein ABIK61_00860 [candidate division WOR-3 bacterium]
MRIFAFIIYSCLLFENGRIVKLVQVTEIQLVKWMLLTIVGINGV